MKLVRNKTREPLRVPLGGGKTLHLGPGKTGQVSHETLDHGPFRKLVDAGRIEIVGDGSTDAGGGGDGGQQPRETTHGHHPTTVVMPKGNR